jgi:hypothetical protein
MTTKYSRNGNDLVATFEDGDSIKVCVVRETYNGWEWYSSVHYRHSRVKHKSADAAIKAACKALRITLV